VPAELSWAHEHADVPDSARDRLVELAGLDGLAELVASLENSASPRRA